MTERLFKRELTSDEERIITENIALTDTQNDAVDALMTGLYEVFLRETTGKGFYEQPDDFIVRPTDYAIPESQAVRMSSYLLGHLEALGVSKDERFMALLIWMNKGPSIFQEA